MKFEAQIVTRRPNCIWQNVELTAKKRLLIQLFTTVQIRATKLMLLLLD